MTNDEILKELLLEKSRNGYAVISVYNSDINKKNRRNGKKSRALENKIIEAGFEYKKISEIGVNGEPKSSFILFEKTEQEKSSLSIEGFIQKCRENQYFSVVEVRYNLKELLEGKSFYHPLLKNEKEDCHRRKEIILENLFEPPEVIGGWRIKQVVSENTVVYHCGDILCGISLQPDGRWLRHYGTIKPVGASIRKEYVETREEAFSNLHLKLKCTP